MCFFYKWLVYKSINARQILIYFIVCSDFSPVQAQRKNYSVVHVCLLLILWHLDYGHEEQLAGIKIRLKEFVHVM